MVGMLRFQPHARAVVQPEPAALLLLVWDLELFAPPNARHPLVVHLPAGTPQQHGDPAVAVAAILPDQFDDVGGQPRLVFPALRRLALRGAVLAEHPAGPAFGDAECLAHMLHARAAARRAQKFP